MNRHHIVSLAAVTLGIVSVVALLHARSDADVGVPEVEINSRFSVADANGDGSVTKAEFAAYLNKLRKSKEPLVSGNVAAASGEKAAGGCCGGKAEGKTAAAPAASGEKAAGGCCGGKAEGKTAAAPTASGEKAAGGCCGGKKTDGKAAVDTTIKAEKISSALLDNVLKADEFLANDNLKGYQEILPVIVESVKNEGNAAVKEKLLPLAEKLVVGTDLKSARTPYEPFSNTLAQFVQAQPKESRQAHVYLCTMTPVLGNARWLQKSNDKAWNPFHGSAMLHCGSQQ
jgi:hypothetical protein